MNPPTTFLLIRHGSVTKLSSEGVPLVYGPDDPLNPAGERQMKTLALTISRPHAPEIIFTSPVFRAHQSANILRDTLPDHPQVFTLEGLRGAYTPQWNGQPVADLIREGGDLFSINPNYPELHGETVPEVYKRATETWEQVKTLCRGRTVAIVAHGEIIGALRHYIRTGPEGKPGIDATIDKGEALLLRFDENGKLIDSVVISPEGQPKNPERR